MQPHRFRTSFFQIPAQDSSPNKPKVGFSRCFGKSISPNNPSFESPIAHLVRETTARMELHSTVKAYSLQAHVSYGRRAMVISYTHGIRTNRKESRVQGSFSLLLVAARCSFSSFAGWRAAVNKLNDATRPIYFFRLLGPSPHLRY